MSPGDACSRCTSPMSFLDLVRKFVNRVTVSGLKQLAWVDCPSCQVDLSRGPCLYTDDHEGVTYYCLCGTASTWDFDSPLPLLMRKEAYK